MTPFPPSEGHTGATNSPNPNPSATESGQDGSGDLRGAALLEQIERLAALLEPEAFDVDVPAREEWRESAKARARFHASRAIFSGYRRVVEDEATLAFVAEILADTDGQSWAEIQHHIDYGSPWASKAREHYLERARVVVRALREDT